MADNKNEEAYLDELLKAMESSSDLPESVPFEDPSVEAAETDEISMPTESLAEDQDDDMMMLSKMFLDDQDDSQFHNPFAEESTDDETDYEASEHETSEQEVSEEYEIPEQDSVEHESVGQEEEEDTSIDDLIRAVQGEINEEAIGEEPQAQDAMPEIPEEEDAFSLDSQTEDASDFLTLNDDMILADDFGGDAESSQEEEIQQAAEIADESDEDLPGPEKEAFEKEDKKKKKKFSLKNFFIKFSDEDEESRPVDLDAQMMRELYGDRESLDDVDPKEEFSKDKKKKKEKKPKAEKPKKAKKPKAAKPKKEKAPKEAAGPAEMIPVGVIMKAVLAAVILIVLVKVGSSLVSYHLAIRHAQNYYNQLNYSAAYEALNGLEIKEKDRDLYMKVKTIVSVSQGLDSYNNYMKLGMRPEALDALVQAVARKNQLEEQAVSYNVSLQVDAVYSEILGILSQYGISEEYALDLNALNDYQQYYGILVQQGGNES